DNQMFLHFSNEFDMTAQYQKQCVLWQATKLELRIWVNAQYELIVYNFHFLFTQIPAKLFIHLIMLIHLRTLTLKDYFGYIEIFLISVTPLLSMARKTPTTSLSLKNCQTTGLGFSLWIVPYDFLKLSLFCQNKRLEKIISFLGAIIFRKLNNLTIYPFNNWKRAYHYFKSK
ncbi:hypothetical protein ACJX0J_030915, partial [Zea mays]